MHGHVVDSDWIVWECFVEIPSIEQATIGHDSIVVPIAHDQLTLGNLSLLGVAFQFRNDTRDIFSNTRGRCIKLALISHQ